MTTVSAWVTSSTGRSVQAQHGDHHLQLETGRGRRRAGASARPRSAARRARRHDRRDDDVSEQKAEATRKAIW